MEVLYYSVQGKDGLFYIPDNSTSIPVKMTHRNQTKAKTMIAVAAFTMAANTEKRISSPTYKDVEEYKHAQNNSSSNTSQSED